MRFNCTKVLLAGCGLKGVEWLLGRTVAEMDLNEGLPWSDLFVSGLAMIPEVSIPVSILEWISQ